MLKKSVSVFLFVLLMSTLLCVPAGASFETEDQGTIHQRYTYLSAVSPALSISGTSVTMGGVIKGYSSVTKIDYIVYLQVKSGSSWSDVRSWTGSKSAATASYSFSEKGSSGKTYRSKTVVTAYSNSTTETVTAYSVERTL